MAAPISTKLSMAQYWYYFEGVEYPLCNHLTEWSQEPRQAAQSRELSNEAALGASTTNKRPLEATRLKLDRIALPPVSQTQITAKEDLIDFNLFRWIEIYGYTSIYSPRN